MLFRSFGNARVSGNVSGNAWVFGDARVCGDAWVSGGSLYESTTNKECSSESDKNRSSYAILSSSLPVALELEVIKFIQEGWEPTGGVSVDSNQSPPVLYQAMIRK